MTVNELIGCIERKIKELGKLKLDQLRMEYPEVAECDVPTLHQARILTKGMTAGDIIAEIIVEDFSREFDIEIDN